MASSVDAFVMSLFSKHLDKRVERTLYATPVLYEFADKHPLPGKKGTHMFVPRSITKNKIATLTEYTAITPSGTSAGYYSGVVSGFGDARVYSDFLVTVSEIPTMISNDLADMAKAAGIHYDRMIVSQISAINSNYINPDGATAAGSVTSTTSLKQRFLFDARATLAKNGVPPYSDGNYWAAISPEGTHDLFVNTSAGGTVWRNP